VVGEGEKGQAVQNESDGPRARDARTCFGHKLYFAGARYWETRARVFRFYFLRRSGVRLLLPFLLLLVLLLFRYCKK